MTTSKSPETTIDTPTTRVPLRLRLSGSDGNDGVWWPQSRDLEAELADLVDHFPSDVGRVYRAVFSRPDWSTAPHRVPIGRGYLKVGSFPGDDTHRMLLAMSTRQTLQLQVIAPDATAESAAERMGPEVAAVVLADEEDEHWNDLGGSWWYPNPVAPSQRPA